MKNILGCCLFKDFVFYLIVACLLLLTLYVMLFPYLLIYEESAYPSEKAVLSNTIFQKVFFSYDFWLHTALASYTLLLTFIVSVLSVAIVLTISINLVKNVYTKNN